MKVDPIPYIIIALGIIVVLIFSLSSLGTKKQQNFQGNSNYTEGTPKLNISDTDYVLKPGIIIREKDINITNKGSGSLTLSGFATSSPHLSAHLFASEQLSPDFVGQNNLEWKTNLDPDQSTNLAIIFDRDKFDWQNPTDQFVMFKTNDSENPEVKISFRTQETKMENETDDQAVDFEVDSEPVVLPSD